jgi:phospholipase C
LATAFAVRVAISTMLLLASPFASAQQQVAHVIVIFQENRSTDNMFHGLPNADIANYGINSKGKKIKLTPLPLANKFDPGHTHQDFENMYDGGKMDGADKIHVKCVWDKQHCPGPHPTFTYVKPSDVAPYFQMAEQYVFGDRMFQTQQGPSFPAHQFIISGTSAPETGSTSFAAENPAGYKGHYLNTGCAAPKKEYVWLIDNNGKEDSRMYPCYEHETLVDLLDQQSVNWLYYTPTLSHEWTAPDAIKHLRFGSDWANVIVPPTQVLKDITKKKLPSVSWVIPAGQYSDHPGEKTQTGPSWVASIVNAVGGSPYWSNTVIFIAWDDWGGFYDHVAPTVVPVGSNDWGAGYAYGFRVPLIIVSPFAKQGYVSHVTHDFGSILKFIEEVFDLPSLGYADAYADDFSDCFQFGGEPRAFRPIVAPQGPEFFLNYKGKLHDPDDD